MSEKKSITNEKKETAKVSFLFAALTITGLAVWNYIDFGLNNFKHDVLSYILVFMLFFAAFFGVQVWRKRREASESGEFKISKLSFRCALFITSLVMAQEYIRWGAQTFQNIVIYIGGFILLYVVAFLSLQLGKIGLHIGKTFLQRDK